MSNRCANSGLIAHYATKAGPIIENAPIQRIEVFMHKIKEPLEMFIVSWWEAMHYELRCFGFHELSNLQARFIPVQQLPNQVGVSR